MPNETADLETCPCCAGFGHVEGLVAVIDDEQGRVEVLEDEECPRCDGTGEVEPVAVRALVADEHETCPCPF